MTDAEIIAEFDALNVDDPEHAHGVADALLLEAVSAEVRAAYDRVVARARWWAAA